MFRLGRVSARDLAAAAAAARASVPTYSAVGASLTAEHPAGFRFDAYARSIPNRGAVYERAVDGLRRWVPHRSAGLTVVPDETPSEGATVAIAAAVGPLTAIAVCRVVVVVDEADRYGFAYGTLPGHPECGEESFVVERDATSVTFRISAFSKPADALARLGSPVTRMIQRRTTRRYLDGLVAFASAAH